ncbi:MAG TPA: type IV toxin-antitoxin system AbiEi family antitoxin, partial [Saprospiraceae bacterium]|nr:type IV toxin-antitoxin system AbiEi family antitoxin [Saprospiraceae bacterium]
MKEDDILQTAVESLSKLTKASIRAYPADFFDDGYRWDGKLEIEIGTVVSNFKAEVKASVLPAAIALWMEKLKKRDTLIVAKYISNPAKALLEDRGINYLDVAGNCFIRNDQGVFLHIRGQVPPQINTEPKHKAFNKNGVKLIYALLLDENLVNEPYRVIADQANVSVSTIGDILSDLQANNFLLQINESKKMLTNKAELLNQWVTAFNQRLKPKLLKGRFRFQLENWRQLNLGNFTFWGGEPAAALLTDFLQPAAWTLYTDLNSKSLIKDLLLAPDPRGNVEVYAAFWKSEYPVFVVQEFQTVHPLLVYAELT